MVIKKLVSRDREQNAVKTKYEANYQWRMNDFMFLSVQFVTLWLSFYLNVVLKLIMKLFQKEDLKRQKIAFMDHDC